MFSGNTGIFTGRRDKEGIYKMSELEKSAERDPVTGLIGMRTFFAVMEKRRRENRDIKAEGEYAVLFFDLVNFRAINLRYGISSGDEYLRRMGKVLTDCFPDGVVAHFDGDRFAVFTNTLHLEEMAADARKKLRMIFPNNVECSIGVCVWDDHSRSAETICTRARIASDENRKHVRTYFSFYTKELGERMETAEYIVSHIDAAVSKGWIVVWYQPVIRALSNQVCGMEALARWNDPERGLLPPADFIGPLEEARQIWKLDLCVIRRVVSEIAERYSRGVPEIPVSINLSRLDFVCCDIFDEIEKLVKHYDVPRRMLHIEVTESIMTSREDAVLSALGSFRSSGYEIWMDDFGSGYSTLNLLKDYPFDLLKMDMAFLHSDSSRAHDIIASVISMDKRIGIRTLAEGVETGEQAAFLKKSGCEKLQGYFYGRPEPFNEMLRHCVDKGLGIETPKQKLCFDALGSVDFMTDIPLAIIEDNDGVYRLLFMNDSAMQMMYRDGYIGQHELENSLNDSGNLTTRELFWAKKYAIVSGNTGEITTRFNGRERLLRFRMLGEYNGTRLFATNIYDRAPSGGDFSQKGRILMNLLSFYQDIFTIDLETRTIQNIRFVGADATRSSFMPIRDEDGRYSPLLPTVFPADLKRYDAFIDPDTLRMRLETTKYGMIGEAFRTRDSNGRFVWMAHRILLVPNTGRKEIFYVVCNTVQESRGADSAPGGEGSRTAGTALEKRTEADEKARLWDELMQHMPMPVFWKDENRRYLGANRSFLNYFRLASENEIFGKTDEEMAWHTNNETWQYVEEQVLKSGDVQPNMAGKCIADGLSRDIFVTRWPICVDDGITGLMGYFFDEAMIPHGLERKEGVSGNDETPGFKTAAQLLDDLVDYENDYQLNKKTYGIVFIRIPELVRIADNYGHSTMYVIACACSDVIEKAVNHAGSTANVGIGHFAVAAAYTSPEVLQKMALRIKEEIDGIHKVNGIPCSLYAKVDVLYTEQVTALRRKLLQLIENPEDAGCGGTVSTEASDTAAGIHQGGTSVTNHVLCSLMDEMPIGCYILRPDHTVLYWNREAENLLGFTAQEMIGRKCVNMPLGCSFINGRDIPDGSCPALAAYATGRAQSMQMFMRHRDGGSVLIRNTLVPMKDSDGTVRELVSLFVPLTDQNYDHDLIRHIYESATRDSLTCLPGRKYMEKCLEEALETFKRTGRPFAVLFADSDNFHQINNTYGHDAGDAILRKLGLALRKYGRKSDCFCRWGGDEFVGLLQLRHPEDIEGAAQRFMKLACSCEVAAGGNRINCRTSIGITVVREDDDRKSVVSRADRYMYQAKRRTDDHIVTDFNAEG
jgi:diguanylate cyclase (GGDEF)-like protein